MSVNATTLTSDITASQLVLTVASVTGASVGRRVRVNNEFIGAVLEVIGLSVSVRGRGDQGTIADAHKASSAVSFGDPADFPVVLPGRTVAVSPEVEQEFYNADGAIALPQRNTTVVLTKGSAAAMTLANPSAAMDGVKLTIIGGTDFAHVVTSSIFQGTTGGAKTTLTTAAFAGSTLVLQALKGRWYQVSNALWVLT